MQDITVEWWDRVMNTNARALWIVTSRLLEELKAAEGTVMNVVSNAAKVPMTHSIAYNASKGAAAIMTRQMARELQKEHGICVFGICPNKLRGTRMSKYIEGRVCELRGWTREQADEYQLKALLAGKETDPYQVAELVVWLLTYKHRHDYLTGCLLELGL
jgi:NAD(P)-dependent dehydrogenase (short-subunit alcohol dehydrogenase family)